jgi:hypothetical protein
LESWPLSPFLNTGATIAVFQSDGILLWLMDAWNINVSAGVILEIQPETTGDKDKLETTGDKDKTRKSWW